MRTYSDQGSSHTAPRGWVYLIVNDLIPSRVKIGYTKRDPIIRAAELITTGTTGTFVVLYQAYVDDPYVTEQEVHKRLAAHNTGLEWFRICPNIAKETILAVAGKVHYEDTTPRWPPSQPEPSQATRELLEEARKAAAERRRKQAEQEASARAAAEAARVKAARQAEQQRLQREAEEYRRHALEAAERARRKAIEEEAAASRLAKQRRFAEAWQRQKARAKRYATSVVLPTALATAMLYAIVGPYDRDIVDKVRAEKESIEIALRESSAERESLATELAEARKRLAFFTETSVQLEASLQALERRQRELDSGLERDLRIQADRLEVYAPYGARTADRGQVPSSVKRELDRLERDIKQKQGEVSEIRGKIKSAKQKRDLLPQEVKRAQDIVAILEERLGGRSGGATRRQEDLRRRLKQSDALLRRMVWHNQLFPWVAE
jgi:hypothetical protein